MRVFSACMKILCHHKNILITQICIFVFFLLSASFMGKNSLYGSFKIQKPTYAFVAEEEGILTEGLAEVLKKVGTLKKVETSKEALMDAGFYGVVDVIFVVPKGYEKAFWSGDEKELLFWQRPDSASGYYMKSAVEQYLSLVRLNKNAGDEKRQEEIVKLAAQAMEYETEVEVKTYKEGGVLSKNIALYFQFMPYILIMAGISGVSSVFLSFRRPEIRMRNLISPIRPFSMAVQKFLFVCAVLFGMWVVLNGVGFLAYFKEWRIVDGRVQVLLLINSFFSMIVVIPLSLLCNCVIKSVESQPFITNLVSLGISFFGGVFVPIEILGEGVLRIAKFLPVYWYEENLSQIYNLMDFSRESLKDVWQNFGLQMGFAAALFIFYLLVNKYMQQAAEDYGVQKTQMEL